MSPFGRYPQTKAIKSSDSCDHLIISTAHKLQIFSKDFFSKYLNTSTVNLLEFTKGFSLDTAHKLNVQTFSERFQVCSIYVLRPAGIDFSVEL